MKKLNKKGFTLIELLVVIAIIGLLSTMAVIALGNARAKARDAKRQSDLKILQTAIELYISDNGSVPDPDATDAWNGTGGTRGSLQNILASYLPGGLPEDPNTGSPRDWIYCWNATNGKYMVATSLEQNKAIAGDLDGDPATNNWATTECKSSDNGADVAAATNCADSNAGIIDDDTSATAICLGSNDS